jgi:hypothetical protein
MDYFYNGIDIGAWNEWLCWIVFVTRMILKDPLCPKESTSLSSFFSAGHATDFTTSGSSLPLIACVATLNVCRSHVSKPTSDLAHILLKLHKPLLEATIAIGTD